MSKLCVLLDPDKGGVVENVRTGLLNLIKEHPSIAEMEVLEVWVGCTREQGRGTRKYINLLRNDLPPSIPVVIFPGNPFQVFSRGDFIIVPDLLNAHRRVIHFLVWLGKSYHRIRKRWAKHQRVHFPLERKIGYMVLSPDSSVGRKLKARHINDDDIMEIITERLTSGWFQKWWGVYIEAGSGAEVSVSERIALIKRLRKLIGKKYEIVTGGGIRKGDYAKELSIAGSTYIVISTVLEESDDPQRKIEEFLENIKPGCLQ